MGEMSMFRNSRRWLYLVFAVLIGLWFTPQARVVFARPGQQTGVANTVEIVGVIDAINGKTLTVNGLTIDISKAQVNLALTVGAKVKIEGLQSANGLTITAREVNAPKTGIQPGESEIVGVVDSVNGTTIVIGGQAIDISNAEVKASVIAGKTVKVEFSIDSAGQLIAREVQVVAATTTVGSKPSVSEENTEITGTLEQVGDGFVIVSGQRFSTNGAEIKGQLIVGALVKVELRDGEAELTAKQLENSHPEDRRRNAGPSNSGKGNTTQVSGGKSGSDDSKSGSDDHGGQDDHNGGSSSDDSHDDHGGNGGSGGDSGSGDHGGGHDDSGGDH
jgi:hypothetical protein